MCPNESPNPSRPSSQAYYRGKAWESRETGGRAAAYRRVDPLAIISLISGSLSFLMIFGWLMVPIPIIGVICGFVALLAITKDPSEKTGQRFAISGLALSIVLGLAGYGFFALVLSHGAPIGYQVVTFTELQPDRKKGEAIPENILKLANEEKFIFLKGYMYPGRRSVGIQQFVLVPSLAHCKFCQRDLASTEMVKVTMVGDDLADYSTHMIGIGGKLKINIQEASRPLGGMPYEIEADVFRE